MTLRYCVMMTMLMMMATAAGLTLAGSACTMSSMMRIQTSDARCTPSFSSASAVDCHQPYIARKQRRNRTTFSLIQVSDVLLRCVIRPLPLSACSSISISLVFANSNDLFMAAHAYAFCLVLSFFRMPASEVTGHPTELDQTLPRARGMSQF